MARRKVKLDVDSIDYGQLDRFVSGKLSGPAKWWVHNVFFQNVRSVNSRSSADANKEFVNGANWSVAKKEVLKALNAEISSLGIKASDIQFHITDYKIYITLQVDTIYSAEALLSVIFALVGVDSKVGVIESKLTKLLNDKFSNLGTGIRLSGVTIRKWGMFHFLRTIYNKRHIFGD